MDDTTKAELKALNESDQGGNEGMGGRIIAKLKQQKPPNFTEITHTALDDSCKCMGVADANEYRRLYRSRSSLRSPTCLKTIAAILIPRSCTDSCSTASSARNAGFLPQAHPAKSPQSLELPKQQSRWLLTTLVEVAGLRGRFLRKEARQGFRFSDS
jgi:hypothetical protein